MLQASTRHSGRKCASSEARSGRGLCGRFACSERHTQDASRWNANEMQFRLQRVEFVEGGPQKQ